VLGLWLGSYVYFCVLRGVLRFFDKYNFTDLSKKRLRFMFSF
jgi:hypothetical protein